MPGLFKAKGSLKKTPDFGKLSKSGRGGSEKSQTFYQKFDFDIFNGGGGGGGLSSCPNCSAIKL